jgi:phage gp36-like protein
MGYCSVDDLIAAVGATDLNKICECTVTSASTIVLGAIAAADRKIDMYLAKRYSVPFTDGSVPDTARRISIDFTHWNLRNDRSKMSPELNTKYLEWKEQLEAISKSEMDFPGATEVDPITSGTQITGNDVIFSRDDMGSL